MTLSLSHVVSLLMFRVGSYFKLIFWLFRQNLHIFTKGKDAKRKIYYHIHANTGLNRCHLGFIPLGIVQASKRNNFYNKKVQKLQFWAHPKNSLTKIMKLDRFIWILYDYKVVFSSPLNLADIDKFSHSRRPFRGTQAPVTSVVAVS